jgi:hypothetical protein
MNRKKQTALIILSALLIGNYLMFQYARMADHLKKNPVRQIASIPFEPNNYLLTYSDKKLEKWHFDKKTKEAITLPEVTEKNPITRAFADEKTLILEYGKNLYQITPNWEFKRIYKLYDNEKLIGINENKLYFSVIISDKVNLYESNLSNPYKKTKLFENKIETSGEFQNIQIDKISTFLAADYDIYLKNDKKFTKIKKDIYNDYYLFYLSGNLFFTRQEKGIEISKDMGKTWQSAQKGLDNYFLKFLVKNNKDLYGITPKGKKLYKYDPVKNKWQNTNQKAW